MKKYLVCWIYDGNAFWRLFDSEYEFMNFYDMSDCYPFTIDQVYELDGANPPKELHYKGWQPGCKIEFLYDNGKTALVGIGTDH